MNLCISHLQTRSATIFSSFLMLVLSLVCASVRADWNPGFATDPNCVAVWNLENVALTTDSKGTNTLTNHGVDANTVDYWVGAASGDFERLDGDYMDISDGSLSAGFPSNSTNSDAQISVCGWFKMESRRVVASPASDDWVIGKWQTNKQSWLVAVRNYNYANHLTFYIGTGGGTSSEKCEALTPGIDTAGWFHFGMTFDAISKIWHLRIWEEDGDHLYDHSDTATNAWNISDSTVSLSSEYAGSYFDGDLDEVAVFNDILTSDQIDQIRNGAFTTAADPAQVIDLILY